MKVFVHFCASSEKIEFEHGNIGYFSPSYFNKEVGCTSLLYKNLLIASSLNTIRKYHFIATSLSGIFVECRPHN